MCPLSWRVRAGVVSFYFLLATIQAWPLPLHLFTGLTAPLSSDAGVYVWNTWVFAHEIQQHRSPLHTELILPLGGPIDLSLHNYTIASNLLAWLLQPLLGVLGAFNVVSLLNVALAGLGMFLLARQVSGTTAEAVIAGALFACSPFLVTRGNLHLSLAAAAPLPLFVYWFNRTWESRRVKYGIATSAMLAWAAYSDPYYAVYCVLLGLFILASHVLALERTMPATTVRRGPLTALDIAIALSLVVIAIVHFGGGQSRLGPIVIGLRSLYTPVLIVTSLVVIRVWLTIRPTFSWRMANVPSGLWAAGIGGTVTAFVLLSPILITLAARTLNGRLVAAPVPWRSSAPGLDLISFLLPNPNHPWAPAAMIDWLAHQPGRYEENVASLPLVALGVLLFACRAGWRPQRFWLVLSTMFLLLALGPFIHVAGVQTYIPTPWTLLRYVPILGEARMPPRFAIVVMLGLSVLFATALASLTARFPARRGAILIIVSALLAFELTPIPRPLAPAGIPAIFETIADDPRPVRVLDIPFGIRDGLSSLGDFSAESQFFQTVHHKALIGGYLSRVSTVKKALYLDVPVLRALIDLSESRPVSAKELEWARHHAPSFLEKANVGYVVVNTRRATPLLRRQAIEMLGVTFVQESDGYELFVPSGKTRGRQD